MADNNILGGFQAISDMLTKPSGMPDNSNPDSTTGGSAAQDIDPDDLQALLNSDEPVIEGDPEDNDDGNESNNDTDDSTQGGDDQNIADEGDDSQDGDDTGDAGDAGDNDLTEFKEMESEISSFFADELAKELGWEFGEDKKFESVKDITSFLVDVVNDNSKPRFANEEVQKLNDYVEQGGDLKKFYSEAYTGKVDVDKIDIESEADQKRVLRENLLNQGFSDAKAEKMITGYENAGMLDEAAEEALEMVKEYNNKKQETLFREQEKVRLEAEKQQQKFVSDVNTRVGDILKDIQGSKSIPKKEEQELLDYIFKPGKDGMTQYQKDMQEDSVRSVIEAAYFTKNKNKLAERLKQQGASTALKDLQTKLKTNKGKRNKTTNQDFDNASVKLSSLSKGLLMS